MTSTETFVLNFNPENLPSGTRKDEMLPQALARLRRIFLSEIEVNGVKAVIMEENGSVLQDGDIVNRVSSIPIIEKINTDVLTLYTEAPPGEHFTVLSDLIVLPTTGHSPVVQGIPIAILPPGERLRLSLYIKTGSVLSTRSVHFSPVSTVYFRPLDDEDEMEFVVELVRGYTEEDFDRFYEQALNRMAKNGGDIPKQRRVGREIFDPSVISDDIL